MVEKTLQTKRLPIKNSQKDTVFDAVNVTLIAILLSLFIIPLMNVLSYSLSDPRIALSRQVWLFPRGFTFQAYERIYRIKQIWIGYANSLFYAIVGTAINLVVTICAAYPLSKRDFAGRNIVTVVFVFTMFFGGGLIPTYLLVRSLGILDTRWAMIIPNAMQVYYVIIMRTFFQTTISSELMDAAAMDGAKPLRVLVSIVLPLSMPVIAVIALYYFVGHWNSYFNALIYLTDSSLYPLQLVLRDYLISNVAVDSINETGDTAEVLAQREVLKYALIVVASVPMLVIYPLAQRHFVKGVMVGSLKG